MTQHTETSGKVMDPIPEYITLHAHNVTYLVNRNAVKFALWHRIPAGLRDPDCEEAKTPDIQTLRVGAKALLRGMLPKMLKKLYGDNTPSIPPREDIIKWALTLLVNLVVDQVALKEWSLDIEACETCENSVYQVRGIVAKPDRETPNL